MLVTSHKRQKMHLSWLKTRDYKAFGGKHEVEIKPITVLIGKNSAGKSTISRLPLLLQSGLTTKNQAPLELENEELSFGASQLDLIHKRRMHGSYSLGFGIQNGPITITVYFDVQYFDEYRMSKLTNLLISSENDDCKITWKGKDPTITEDNYEINDKPISLEFEGIFPNKASIEKIKMTHGLNISKEIEYCRSVFDNISYLGPFRKLPERQIIYPGGKPEIIGTAGRNTASILADDKLRRGGQLFNKVKLWLSKSLPGWDLALAESDDTFSITFERTFNEQKTTNINLMDVGAGVAQVLPLIVQRYSSGERGKNIKPEITPLEIVEQPELHLHPAAHADLADLYLSSSEGKISNYIIETHSENFLLRLRRRVAEGVTSPENIVIYWIEDDGNSSKPEKIMINSDGSLTNWPSGVFSEDFEEIKKINQANKQKQ